MLPLFEALHNLQSSKAAARSHELRSEVAVALEELPMLFLKTRTAMGIFKASKELRECGVELYVATLAALQHIVN